MFKKVEEKFDPWPCVLAIAYEKTLYKWMCILRLKLETLRQGQMSLALYPDYVGRIVLEDSPS